MKATATRRAGKSARTAFPLNPFAAGCAVLLSALAGQAFAQASGSEEQTAVAPNTPTAAATHIGDRSYRTGGGTLAVRREDDAVLVQERAGPGHVHFGTRRHELSLRYTDRAVPDRELVAMPEFGARTAIAARIAMAWASEPPSKKVH